MKFKSAILLACITILSACTGTQTRLDSVRNDFSSGNFEKITATPDSDNMDILIGAHSAFAENDLKTSDHLFESFNSRNIDPTDSGIGSEIGKLVGGQMVGDYKPYMMDFLFVSYYQLWSAMAEGRQNDARVIINQSYARQQKMSATYAKLISERQSNPESEIVENQIASANWRAFSDIMNPALTYLSGLYFLNNGEYENARQYLVRTNGMVPKNNFVKSDLDLAISKTQPEHIAWIFIETGFAPRLREKRIDLPWFFGNGVRMISIATSYPEFYRDTNRMPPQSYLLSDVDAMFITEYREYQINEAMRAIAKSVSNLAIQSTAGKNLGGWGSLAALVFTTATTQAEIRSWVTLPQRIYIMRVKKDKSRLIKLSSGDTLDVEYTGNHIIYVRGNDIKIIKMK